jgi:hypothetical protein
VSFDDKVIIGELAGGAEIDLECLQWIKNRVRINSIRAFNALNAGSQLRIPVGMAWVSLTRKAEAVSLSRVRCFGEAHGSGLLTVIPIRSGGLAISVFCNESED